MLQTVIKLLISSGIIVLVSEVAKKSTYFGGLIASIPLVSVLSLIAYGANKEPKTAIMSAVLFMSIMENVP